MSKKGKRKQAKEKKQIKEKERKLNFYTFELTHYLDKRIFVALLIIMTIICSYGRYWQYQNWKQHKAVYFPDGIPAMTTLDAYHWLRYAKDYKNGTYIPGGKDKLVMYPDGGHYPKPIPMLSYLIAKVSSVFHTSIYYAGLTLVVLLAGLFVIPLGLYLYELDMPMAALAAGFVGNYSWMYYIRTSMGRVDTDLLQLFFLFMASFLTLKAAKAHDTRKTLIYAALTGLNFWLFAWWYGHTGAIVVYMGVLFLMLLIEKVPLIALIGAPIVVGIFANPLYTLSGINNLIGFFSHYLVVKHTWSGGFPNIMKTITETQHIADSRLLLYILSSKALDIIGILGLILAIVASRTKIIAILPVAALGLTAFTGSNRAIMFFAPFVGLGIGFLIDTLASNINRKAHLPKGIVPSSAMVATALLLFGISSYSAVKFIPAPSIAPDIIKSFVQLKHKIKKANVVSWWDYGYAIQDIDGYATYQDGGAHGGARTYLIARALSTDNQTELYHIISFIDRYGIKYIKKKIKEGEKTTQIIKEVLAYNKPIRAKNNYLLFTRDMISKFGAISYLGRWSFKLKKSFPIAYQFLSCSSFRNDTLLCSGNVFDLKKGLIDNRYPIKRLVISSNGHMKVNKQFHDKGVTLELLLKNDMLIYALLCNDALYKTTFNQIYLLGNYDRNRLKEVYNNFPSARMFIFK